MAITEQTSQLPIKLFRRRDSARVLGCSESQILKYEHCGLLKRIALPGIEPGSSLRAVRHSAEEVLALAKRLVEAGKTQGAA